MQEDLQTTTGEEEITLNSEETATWEKENQEANKVFTLEEVEAMRKEMMSNSEKWVQKVISEKKTFEKALKESWKVWANPSYLVDLFEEDPKVAQIILDEFFDWKSIEEYKEDIEYEEDYADPKVMQSKIKKEAEKIAQNNLIESQKKEFISKLKMTDEEKESFEEAFEELKQLKSFTTKDLTKQFEKAYRLSNDNEEALQKLKNQETIAKTMWTWEGKTSKSWWPKKNTAQDEVASFLKLHKII